MKKLKIYLSMLLMITALGFSACSDDDEDDDNTFQTYQSNSSNQNNQTIQTDIRNQAVGSYKGVAKMYLYNEYEETYISLPEGVESEYTIQNATISKEGTKNLTLNLDGTKLKITKINEVKQGFVFDIDGKVTEYTDEGNKLIIEGFDGIECTNSSGSRTLYDGMFYSANKKILLYLIIDGGIDNKILTEFTLTKK